MSTAEQPTFGPSSDTWTAAIHNSESDFSPLGTGLVVDDRRILTCAHVVVPGGKRRDPLWVAFPKAPGAWSVRRQVMDIIYREPLNVADVAILVLNDVVPMGVTAAPLRCPVPEDLVDRPWWAFGFASGDPLGNSAYGTVGAHLGYGWIRLDIASRYVVEQGFSGSGLWSPDYAAVVGLVGQANLQGSNRGDGRGLTLHQVNLLLPDENLQVLAQWSVQAAGEMALSAWGWTLEADPEAGRHWRPRARGVSVDSERGFRFRGRTAALQAVVTWLDRVNPDQRVLVVTGSPGVGKSAVLGRVVTTADPGIRAALPADDQALRASEGSVACAVHAKGKTALDVAVEISRAASTALPAQPRDLAPALRKTLMDRQCRRFNVIIDALDEATSLDQARTIVSDIILPIVETCADTGAQLVVGTRRRDDGGDLLTLFSSAAAMVDLDSDEYFRDEDIISYALASLQLAGEERQANPYADSRVAEPVARRIGELAERNFLIAGLVARTHGLYDDQPVRPAELGLVPPTVTSAIENYLVRLPGVGQVSAKMLLTALAFAEAPGLPLRLWQLAAAAIDAPVTEYDLAYFARSSAANFLIESTASGNVRTFRLFHQALNDALLAMRNDVIPRQEDERAITERFVNHGREQGWSAAEPYLLRSLPMHADHAGMIDDLLLDDDYLLNADLRRLIPLAGNTASVDGRAVARFLRMTPEAIPAAASMRAALFSITAALEGLGRDFVNGSMVPYRARWASVSPRTELAVLVGHVGAVLAVCAVTVGKQVLLASAGNDRSVRIWDPATGEELRRLAGNAGAVLDVCAVSIDGREMLASAGDDRSVRIWDPATGQQLRQLDGHASRVNGVCAVSIDGHEMLASAGNDRSVRIWDPATGEELRRLAGNAGAVLDVCAVSIDGREMLASAGDDRSVRIWDPATGQQLRQLDGHANWVRSVCMVMVGKQVLLASASSDASVRIWDPATGQQLRQLDGHARTVSDVCTVSAGERFLVASVNGDASVRIWDPATGQQLRQLDGHTGAVYGACALTVDERPLLASASNDTTVRIWDPAPEQRLGHDGGHTSAVLSVCAVTVGKQVLLASASNDTSVRIWDPATGRQLRQLDGHASRVNGVCAVSIDGHEMLASASNDTSVRIWDPATGRQLRQLDGHASRVNGVCAVTVGKQVLLASASNDTSVRIWDPATGRQLRQLRGHASRVNGVCAVSIDGHEMLASASNDTSVRIWDPATGQQLRQLRGHASRVNGVCAVSIDGHEMLASASNDNSVRIWDPGTGRQVRQLRGHRGKVYDVCATTVDGQIFLASAGLDRTVRLWGLDSGSCLLSISVHLMPLAIGQVSDLIVVGLRSGLLCINMSNV